MAYPDTTGLLLSGGQGPSSDSLGFAVSRSTNSGSSWTRRRFAYPRWGYCKALAVRTGTEAAAYAGGWVKHPGGVAGAVFKSTDFGATWESLPTSPADTVTAIFADYEQGPRVFCATTGGLSLTTDEGLTWTRPIAQRGMRAVTGLPNLHVAAGDSGVWVSTDSGTSWAKMDSGLKVKKVNCLGFVTSAGGQLWLLAGTDGGATSIWDFGLLAAAEPHRVPISSRPVATVCGNRLQVRMEKPGDVSLVDASGRTVLKASLPRGAAELDISRLPAGVYQVVPSPGSAASRRIVKSR